MFFKDEHNIDVIQLGTGDVMVGDIYLKDICPSKIIGIAFAECEKGEIDRELPGFSEKIDYEIGVKLKILFTDPKSIDVVINELKQAKKLMLKKRKERTRNVNQNKRQKNRNYLY